MSATGDIQYKLCMSQVTNSTVYDKHYKLCLSQVTYCINYVCPRLLGDISVYRLTQVTYNKFCLAKVTHIMSVQGTVLYTVYYASQMHDPSQFSRRVMKSVSIMQPKNNFFYINFSRNKKNMYNNCICSGHRFIKQLVKYSLCTDCV